MFNTPAMVETEPLLPLALPHCQAHVVEPHVALLEAKGPREPDLPFHLPVLTRDMVERRTQTRLENQARMMQHCHDRIDQALDQNMLGWR